MKNEKDWDNLPNGAGALSIIAQVDYNYFIVSNLEKRLHKVAPKSNIDIMIDKAVGFDPVGDIKKDVEHAVSEIVRLKKRLRDEYEMDGTGIEHDEATLQGLQQMSLTPKHP